MDQKHLNILFDKTFKVYFKYEYYEHMVWNKNTINIMIYESNEYYKYYGIWILWALYNQINNIIKIMVCVWLTFWASLYVLAI